MEWLNNIIPNVMADTDRLFDSILATLNEALNRLEYLREKIIPKKQ